MHESNHSAPALNVFCRQFPYLAVSRVLAKALSEPSGVRHRLAAHCSVGVTSAGGARLAGQLPSGPVSR